MILLDMSQIAFANLNALFNSNKSTVFETEFIKYMILNSIRMNNVKFRNKYGKMVIACDGQYTWRKKVFPFYKKKRGDERKKSPIDWDKFFGVVNELELEMKEHFPYPVIKADSAEADDIIAVLAKHFGTTEYPIAPDYPRNLILSRDHDYHQLHVYTNTDQYDPVKKQFITCSDPIKYLHEHIMKGDIGDGIPNVRSKDNSIVDNIRQLPVSKKLIDSTQESLDNLTSEEKINYSRNKLLIDFSSIPNDIQTDVLNQYESQKDKNKRNLMNYFMKNKMKSFIEMTGDF